LFGLEVIAIMAEDDAMT